VELHLVVIVDVYPSSWSDIIPPVWFYPYPDRLRRGPRTLPRPTPATPDWDSDSDSDLERFNISPSLTNSRYLTSYPPFLNFLFLLILLSLSSSSEPLPSFPPALPAQMLCPFTSDHPQPSPYSQNPHVSSLTHQLRTFQQKHIPVGAGSAPAVRGLQIGITAQKVGLHGRSGLWSFLKWTSGEPRRDAT
jgi:hypothetical protein